MAIHGHMINALVQSCSIACESSQLPVNLIPINSVAEFDELEIKLQAGNVAKALVSHWMQLILIIPLYSSVHLLCVIVSDYM